MIVLNLYGGPGVGKSTTAAMLFAHYKRRGIRAEIAREQAKDFVYQGRDLERNQILLMALQYQVLKDLEASGTELAISDSPLRQQLDYSRALPYFNEMAALNWTLCRQFKEVNVLLKRAVSYQTHGREQTEEQARAIDSDIEFHRYDMTLGSPAPETVIRFVDARVLPLLERR
jgi:adenylate kinase family enzyme